MLMLCEAARDYIKAILSINIRSWQSGHEEGNPGA
jgi:hypothetical protein